MALGRMWVWWLGGLLISAITREFALLAFRLVAPRNIIKGVASVLVSRRSSAGLNNDTSFSGLSLSLSLSVVSVTGNISVIIALLVGCNNRTAHTEPINTKRSFPACGRRRFKVLKRANYSERKLTTKWELTSVVRRCGKRLLIIIMGDFNVRET